MARNQIGSFSPQPRLRPLTKEFLFPVSQVHVPYMSGHLRRQLQVREGALREGQCRLPLLGRLWLQLRVRCLVPV